jgi:hypothetical protein
MANVNQNVTAATTRLKAVSPGMWDDFYNDTLHPFSKVSYYKNDFHSFVPSEWTVTEVDVGAGNTTQTILDYRDGVLSLTSAQNEDDGSQIQLGGTSDSTTTGEAFAPALSKNLWFECRFRMNDVTQQDMFVGLHVQDTTIIASKGSDFIGFKTDDGDALLDAENSAGGIVSTEAGLKTLVDNTWYTVGFKVTGTQKIEFYVDGKLLATQYTNIPTALMQLSIAQLTGEAAANNLDVDYIVIAQDRG